MRTTALTAALLAITACLTGARADGANSRIYDLIDLSTPASAVEAYADAYAHDDFTLLYFVLDPEAHEAFMMSVRRLDFADISGITLDQYDAGPAAVANELALRPDAPWLGPDILQIFVFTLTVSDINRAHLIDFPQSPLRSPVGIEAIGEPFVEEGRTRVWVETAVAGEGPVRFLLQQSPADRWRVLSIVARPGTQDEAVFLPYDE